MKRMLLLLSLALPSLFYAQSILRNGALEDPTAFALNPDAKVEGEYFHAWHSIGERNPVYLYDTEEVSIKPVDGLGLIRFTAYETGKQTQTQHLVGELTQSMRTDCKYTVTFSIALDRTSTHATNPFEIFFSDRPNETGKKSFVSYVIDEKKPITNMRWREVTFEYTPTGKERYFHIKLNAPEKIHTLENLNVERYDKDSSSMRGAHYYLDAISIVPDSVILTPVPTESALALIVDMRGSHASLQYDFKDIQKRLNALEEVQWISILTLNEFPSLQFRGHIDSLNFSDFQKMIEQNRLFGNGNVNDALEESYNSIVEYQRTNHIVFVSENNTSMLPTSFKTAQVTHWKTGNDTEEFVPQRRVLSASYVSHKKQIAARKTNHYSFAYGAVRKTPATIKHIRSELSQLVGLVDDKDIVSFSSYNYGDIVDIGVSPDTLPNLFYSKNITEESFQAKDVSVPMHDILDEIGDYKAEYYVDFHSDDHNHRVIGVSDALIAFEEEDYPYYGYQMLNDFKSLSEVIVHLAVFNETKGTFEYYNLHRDAMNWVPCSREELFPTTQKRAYYSYYFQDYINVETSTDKQQ